MTEVTDVLVKVVVCPQGNKDITACVSVRCQSCSDGIMAHQVDVEQATGRSFRPAIAQVLKSEIVAGLLTGRHKATGGWTLTVESVAGQDQGKDALLTIPSVGYAVAATLAVLHGTAVEDLRVAPHGGHGWELIHLEVH